MGGLKVVHAERVPREGALIVAPAHFSNIDPPAVACAIPRQLDFMAKEDLFRVPILGWLIRSVGAFPVRRDAGDSDAVRLAIKMLESGRAVLMFPEGRRGDAFTLGTINRGIAVLAKRTGAAVLPVAIVGTHKMLPRGQSRPKRYPVRVAFGEPFSYGNMAKPGSEKENREAFALELERRLMALSAEQGLPLRSESKTGS